MRRNYELTEPTKFLMVMTMIDRSLDLAGKVKSVSLKSLVVILFYDHTVLPSRKSMPSTLTDWIGITLFPFLQ